MYDFTGTAIKVRNVKAILNLSSRIENVLKTHPPSDEGIK